MVTHLYGILGVILDRTFGNIIRMLRVIRLPKEERGHLSWTFVGTLAVILAYGLIMMFSASYSSGYTNHGGNIYYFIKPQAIVAAVGFVVMLGVSLINYRALRYMFWTFYVITLALLVLALFMPSDNNGCYRWVYLPGVMSPQPSELAKFSLVLLFSHLLVSNEKKLGRFRYGIFPFAVVLGVYAGLIVKEPHLSATILLVVMGGIMLVVGGLPMKWIAAAGGIAAAGVAAIMLVPSLHERAMERITIWKNPASDPLGTGYQILQSLYAIGSGGLMGSGIGNSRQKYLFLPEPQNDYVFSVVCEELGFMGALVVIVLFALLIWRGFTIVIKARDRFGAMLVTGFIAQVGVQAILNMAVVTNTIPSTGISLPFFSYGGTALAILLGEMGIVLSVSRQTTVEKE